MAHLAACSSSLSPVKKHQDTIILSLKDRDISVRRRALDLLYSMCDTSNSKVIVGELVRYLQVADYNLREEMVLKIAILTERFATEVSLLITLGDRTDMISTSGMSIRYYNSFRRRVTMSARKYGIELFSSSRTTRIYRHMPQRQCSGICKLPRVTRQ
jgi:hypothetical protein